MPHGILVARRVTLAFSHTPRRCFARPCVPTLLVPRHGRLLHAGSSARAPSKKKRSRDDEQAPDADFDTLWKEAAEVESKEPSPQKPEKDDSWLFDHAGPKISVLDGEVSTEGYDDFVTHEGGAKLISSWSIAPGDEPVMWVPGDAPRLKDIKLPVTLEPEMIASETSSGKWSMGSPQSSFEPFFASLAAMNPRAKFDNTDVIARATELQMLAGVARRNFKPFGNANQAQGFQFQVVKNTLLIKKLLNTKRSGRTLGRGMTPTLQGSFFNKITEMQPSEKDISPDHYQAMRYDMGPLHCVAITAVDAGTGSDSLPRVKVFDTSALIPKGPHFVDVRQGGRGVAPSSVAIVNAGIVDREGVSPAVNSRGTLKMRPGKLFATWLRRPASIVQGQLEQASLSPGASEEAAQLTRISVRNPKAIFHFIEDAWALEFRKLIVLLRQMRDVATKAGGPCILTYQPPKRPYTAGPITEPAKFEIYKCTPEAAPMVLDWHVEQFWSKD